MITIKRKIHFRQGRGNRKEMQEGGAPPPAPVQRVPRVSKLMALAIRFDQLIHDGRVADQAELARLGHVTRARVSQIMNLLHLAPDIQEEILDLPPVAKGRAQLIEPELRPIAAEPDWEMQRRMWRELRSS